MTKIILLILCFLLTGCGIEEKIIISAQGSNTKDIDIVDNSNNLNFLSKSSMLSTDLLFKSKGYVENISSLHKSKDIINDYDFKHILFLYSDNTKFAGWVELFGEDVSIITWDTSLFDYVAYHGKILSGNIEDKYSKMEGILRKEFSGYIETGIVNKMVNRDIKITFNTEDLKTSNITTFNQSGEVEYSVNYTVLHPNDNCFNIFLRNTSLGERMKIITQWYINEKFDTLVNYDDIVPSMKSIQRYPVNNISSSELFRMIAYENKKRG